jgi:phosphatidylserine/phosphatidylglycerophosphate/cardiolipin synthase-like enzyme
MLPIQPFKGQLRRIDMRNHRKIVVIDGLIAHAGSQNLIVDHYHQKKNIAPRPALASARSERSIISTMSR